MNTDTTYHTSTGAMRSPGIDESGTVSRMAARAEDMAHRGIERARSAAEDMRHRAVDMSDATAHRIQQRPLRSVMMAAAFGAAATLLLAWLMRPSRHDY